MTFRAVSGDNKFFAVDADRPLPITESAGGTKIRDGAEVIFTNSGIVELFDAKNGIWFESPQSKSLKYTDTFSGTGTALGTTDTGVCNALGLPFDSLTFTASGAVNQVDVHVHLHAGGGVIIIENLNGDTIDIAAATGAESYVPNLVKSDGTIIAASDANLTAPGVYYLYNGK